MDFQYLAAIDMARIAHKGQTRKYTGEPYISHPFSVAGLVAAVSTNDDMLVAALLHDIVEDTDVTIETVQGVFGVTVASLVSDLTDISKPEDGNRKKRKELDRIHTAAATRDAKTIKLADLIDNTKTIIMYDPKFAKVYMEEKRLLLEVLGDGDKMLFTIADRMVQEYFKSI